MQTKPVLSLDCEEQVFDLSFHPSRSLVAAGTIEGQVLCFDYGQDLSADAAEPSAEPSLLFNRSLHKHSCRSVDFGLGGAELFSVSKDKSLQMVDLSTGKVRLRKGDAHGEPINIVKSLGADLLATGDDSGCIKIWDTRQRRSVRKYHENRDFIADLEYSASKDTLLAAGGDGCLSIFDLKQSKPVNVSASQDDELLSVKLVRDGARALVGTQSGTLLLFTWNDWGDCTDRFPGHPMSVSSLVKETETTLFTGSSDGIVRSISLFPNQLIGAVADTGEAMPIEKMRASWDAAWLGTCSHDQYIKFWTPQVSMRVSDDDDEDDDDQDDSDEDGEGVGVDNDSFGDDDSEDDGEEQDLDDEVTAAIAKKLKGLKGRAGDGEGEDGEDEGDWEDEDASHDDDDDDEDGNAGDGIDGRSTKPAKKAKADKADKATTAAKPAKPAKTQPAARFASMRNGSDSDDYDHAGGSGSSRSKKRQKKTNTRLAFQKEKGKRTAFFSGL
ncbi:WD40-repeat-containing domain protein [Entophlyctis helioformis]|nr:WD40-repeat-containing domain protein [Entophlyctis helioformis]